VRLYLSRRGQEPWKVKGNGEWRKTWWLAGSAGHGRCRFLLPSFFVWQERLKQTTSLITWL
jgi:hypothetical protein